MSGNAIWGGGAGENFVRLSIYAGPMETVKYTWVNIWSMLDWIVGFRNKNTEMPLLGM